MREHCCIGIGLISLLAAASTADEATGPARREYPNLVYNASFETPAWLRPEQAELWQERPNIARDASVARTGQASLRIRGPGRGYTFQKFLGLVPDTKYVLSAQVKAAGLKGKGVRLVYLPTGSATAPVQDTGGWQRVEVRFTTPGQLRGTLLRVQWDLAEGDVAWVDDVRLEPADGDVPAAPAPRIAPPGGSFEGPVEVTLAAGVSDARICYTIDGSDPTIFSTLYTEPFRLAGPAAVKARVVHGGMREGEVARAGFALKPKLGPGVPFSPVGWGRDVATWWAGHIHNPASPHHLQGPIQSPGPRVNVADVRDAHPETTTGGIEEALARLPPAGGTLWFPKGRGPYVVTKSPQKVKNYYDLGAPVMVLRRSNLHFLSDGAVIRCQCKWPFVGASGNVVGIFTFASMDYADRQVSLTVTTNFYFKGLVFDGGGLAPGALVFRHAAEVLVDDCTFRHFAADSQGHPGAISAASCADDIWVRRCRFEQGKYAIYWDGVHGGGLLDCRFGPKLRGCVLMLTNNDMAFLSASQRTCQYVVIQGCTFQGPGHAPVQMTAANVLIQGNTATGQFRDFLGQTGRGKSNVKPRLRYDGCGVQVLDNRAEHVETFVGLRGDVCRNTALPPAAGTLIRGNRVGRAAAILSLDPAANLDYFNRDYARIENVTVAENRFGGTGPLRLRANPDALERIRNVRIAGNTFADARAPVVTDLQDKPVRAEGIVIQDNAIRSLPRR